MRRYGHYTIRYEGRRYGYFRYDTDTDCKNTNIYTIHILLFMNTTGMLHLVSFTNTVTRLTKELDKTNLFVKLKKQCTVEVLKKNVKKMTLVLRTHSIYTKTSVFTCIVHV